MMGGGGRSSLPPNLRKAGRCRAREPVLGLPAAPPTLSSPGGGVLSSSGLIRKSVSGGLILDHVCLSICALNDNVQWLYNC